MDYKLISNYLDYCKTHKRLSSHTQFALIRMILCNFITQTMIMSNPI